MRSLTEKTKKRDAENVVCKSWTVWLHWQCHTLDDCQAKYFLFENVVPDLWIQVEDLETSRCRSLKQMVPRKVEDPWECNGLDHYQKIDDQLQQVGSWETLIVKRYCLTVTVARSLRIASFLINISRRWALLDWYKVRKYVHNSEEFSSNLTMKERMSREKLACIIVIALMRRRQTIASSPAPRAGATTWIGLLVYWIGSGPWVFLREVTVKQSWSGCTPWRPGSTTLSSMREHYY